MSLINPADSLERQNEKLLKIADALMRRVEYGTDDSGAAYAQFERAALLEKRVRERTGELERTLDLLHESNAQLARTMQEREAAQRNLSDAIETVSEGFALFDGDDLLIMCNSRFCQEFRDTVTGLEPGLPFSSYVEMISQSDHLALPQGLGPGQWAERRLQRHADLQVMFNVALSGDRWLQVSEQRTGTGGTVVLQTDVTDLVRVERLERDRLRDSQTRMIRATLDHLNQGVSIFDDTAQLVGWNAKLGTLVGLPARRLQLGVSFFGLLDQLDASFTFARGLDRQGFAQWAQETGPRPPISFELRGRTGAMLQVFGRGMPDGGFVLSVTDVTTEREAAAKLAELNEVLENRVIERTNELEDALSAAERANASKSRFVAAASHDLLQPLSAAKLYLSALQDRMTRPEDSAILTKAESALGGAEEIIEALLDISKLDGDGLRFDIRQVPLRDVLEPLRLEMEAHASAKGLDLRMVSSDLIIQTDPAYLRRILQNLMGNAIRYTASGRVLVGVRRNGASARVEVWDSGPGIAQDDQRSIFEEFRRLDSTASANDGLGLGLAIVERACARLGHPLGLWSEPGRGSCFMVNLPIAGIAGPAPRPATPSLETPVLTGMVALLVENDPQMRRAMSVLMESWGVGVLEVEDAEAALHLLEDLEITPDVLLLDYQLGPGADGLALYAELTRRLGPLPCAIVSADRSSALRQVCKAQSLPLLSKPVDRAKLAGFLSASPKG